MYETRLTLTSCVIMCGIFGLIHPDGGTVRHALPIGTTAVAHRGPDGSGEVILPFGTGFLGLGHRRLSILELSSLGHQPMKHCRSGCYIIFNGEIYNFRRLRAHLESNGETFKSSGDTEVLLAGLVHYGPAFLEQLEGMYAFAFFDPRAATVMLARDPAGIKPLYVAKSGAAILFSSETRSIIATGLLQPRLDPRGLAGFLAYGAVQHPLTVFKDITSLAPGSHCTIGIGPNGRWREQGRAKVFWKLPRSIEAIPEAAAVHSLRIHLERAVRDHLISDVPVGLFLSSGLDSTILGGLASRHKKDLKSFTVVFEDEPDLNEQRLAAETARLFQFNHTELTVPSSMANGALRDWFAVLDQPSIDGLNVYIISRAVREQNIKVALTGLGADELFGGYPSFRDVPRLWSLARLLHPLPAEMRRKLARIAMVGQSGPARSKLCDMLGGNGSLRSLCLQRRRLMSNLQLRRLGHTASDLGLDEDFLTPQAAPDTDADTHDPVRVISQVEFRLYQGNMLLRDADVNGMACGMELRVPFLDQRLLNFALGLPGLVRRPRRAAQKCLLRKAFPGLLRPNILKQRKRGFSLPIARWMVGPLRTKCQEALSALNDSRVLDPSGVNAVWNQFLAEPESPMWSRAFALVVLGEFCRLHAVSA
jgi:asparagine synthase (glutamine-hydrolysing)